MKPNIILHVGTEKTGSTSIQQSFASNQSYLKDRQIFYPSNLGATCHLKLTACALKGAPNHPIRKMFNLNDDASFEDFRESTLRELSSEIEASNYETLIFSDEHINCHLVRPGLLENYFESLELFGTVSKVIIYLRRQDLFRISLFSESIKAGNITSFMPDNPLIPFKVIPDRFNYLKILNRLSQVFGTKKLEVVLFQKNDLYNNNVVDDFIKRIDLDLIFPEPSEISSNTSLDARIMHPLSVMLHHHKDNNIHVKPEIHNTVMRHLQTHFKGRGARMHPEVHAKFLDVFSTMNETIRNIYFDDKPDSLFDPIDHLPYEDGTYYPDCSMSFTDLIYNLISRGT